MEPLSWFATALIVLTVALMFVVVLQLPRTARTFTERFYCPWQRRAVLVRFLTRDGRTPTGVLSCTAFADPTVVMCGTPCLGDRLPPAARASSGTSQ
jgi:hypothetical protein